MSINMFQLVCDHEWGISINWIEKCKKCGLVTNTPNFKELADMLKEKLCESNYVSQNPSLRVEGESE